VCYSVQQDGTIVKHLFNLQISLVQPVTQCRSQPFLLVKGPNELIKNVGMTMARDSSAAIVELVDRTVNTAVVAPTSRGPAIDFTRPQNKLAWTVTDCLYHSL
jgi:hypothetical protein